MTASEPPTRRRRQALLNDDIGPLLARLAVPLGLGMLSTSLYAAVDAYFLGLLGPFPLSALGFALPLLLILNNLAMSVGLGTAACTARDLGRGDEDEAALTLSSACVLGLVVALVAAVLGLVSLEPFFRWLGAEPRTLGLARSYMTISYAGLPFLFLHLIGNHALRATGDTRSPGWILIGTMALNAVLDPLLIFGWGPFPRLEMAGAAWATLFSRALGMAVVLGLLVSRDRLLRWRKIALARLIKAWRDVLAIALPAVFGRWLFPCVMLVLTARISSYGNLAVAGLGVGLKIESLLMVVTAALAAALLPFVGQNWSAERPDRVRRGLRGASFFALGWGILTWGLLLWLAPSICGLFSREPQVVEAAASYLRIVGASLGLQGMAALFVAALNAVGRPLQAAALTLLRMVVLYLPLALLGAELAGVTGMFVGGSLGNVLAGLATGFLGWRFFSRRLPTTTDREVVVRGGRGSG